MSNPTWEEMVQLVDGQISMDEELVGDKGSTGNQQLDDIILPHLASWKAIRRTLRAVEGWQRIAEYFLVDSRPVQEHGRTFIKNNWPDNYQFLSDIRDFDPSEEVADEH